MDAQNAQNLSTDHVNVPRARLEEWSRLLDALATDDHFGRNARDQLAEAAEQVRYWSTQHGDPSGVRVSQLLGDVAHGSTVVGYRAG